MLDIQYTMAVYTPAIIIQQVILVHSFARSPMDRRTQHQLGQHKHNDSAKSMETITCNEQSKRMLRTVGCLAANAQHHITHWPIIWGKPNGRIQQLCGDEEGGGEGGYVRNDDAANANKANFHE